MICKICGGRKIVIGCGYMEHECSACDGNGYIEAFPKPIKEKLVKEIVPMPEINPPKISVAEVVTQAIKRRGRPKKSIEEAMEQSQ